MAPQAARGAGVEQAFLGDYLEAAPRPAARRLGRADCDVPLFALANVGVRLNADAKMHVPGARAVTVGVVVGLVVGMVVGITAFTWIAVRVGPRTAIDRHPLDEHRRGRRPGRYGLHHVPIRRRPRLPYRELEAAANVGITIASAAAAIAGHCCP